MADSTVRVAFVGDTRDFQRAVGQISGSTKRLETGFAGFSRKLGTLGKLSIAGLGAHQLIGALNEVTSAAAQEEQEIAKLNRTLKNAGVPRQALNSIDTYITKLQNTAAVADSELRPALSTLVTATGDLAKGQELLALALDISAAKGVDVEQVAASLAKAQNGQLRGLRAYGVNLLDASGKTVNFATAQERLAKAFGGSSATAANTAAGRLKTLGLRFDDLKEKLGAKLLPVIEKVASFFLDTIIPFFEGGLPNALNTSSQSFDGIRDVLEDLAEIFRTVVDTATALWRTFGDNILEFARRSFGPLKQFIGGVLEAISGVIKVFAGLLTGDWSKVWEGLKAIVTGVLNAVIGIIKFGFEQFRFYVKAGLEVLGGLLSGAWDGLVEGAKTAFGAIVEFVRALPGRLLSFAGQVFNAALQLGEYLLKGIVKGISGVVGEVTQIGKAVANAIIGFINDQVIDRINSALEIHIDVPLGPDIDLDPPNIPHIPQLAAGGIVTRPTLALIGERGPEAVVPLGRGGFGNVQITINAGAGTDSLELERAVTRALANAARRGVRVA